jgi:hypothetical protein
MAIVGSTADILAILGGATTFIAAVFAAVRLSRCQRVTCCWGALDVINKPIPSALTTTSSSEVLEKTNLPSERQTISSTDVELTQV